MMVARERRGSPDGLFLAAKGGYNVESHNHNDVGPFIVALDARPVLVDVGVGEYTARWPPRRQRGLAALGHRPRRGNAGLPPTPPPGLGPGSAITGDRPLKRCDRHLWPRSSWMVMVHRIRSLSVTRR
ncbi:hypothetical protein ACFY3V_34860 [Streptosporangium sp. NPDC000095]|uniref:hypothetical protein n=1 Tax=Streptosporangium sp. NPDC000095 TaxID=3366184 RepID=UPI0036BAA9D6